MKISNHLKLNLKSSNMSNDNFIKNKREVSQEINKIVRSVGGNIPLTGF
jgi:hypothetical protein